LEARDWIRPAQKPDERFLIFFIFSPLTSYFLPLSMKEYLKIHIEERVGTMAKIHTIYKEDKWNMITAEVEGSRITVREISTEWGEDTYVFNGRHEMMDWAEKHFAPDKYDHSAEILAKFKEI
jgi:hypothetical protein